MNSKLLRVAYWLTNIFIFVLIVCAVALPWAGTLYVETMGLSQKLPAIIMVTCYPCVPFAGAILLYLRRIIRNISTDMLFHLDNMIYFKRISLFCLVIALITLIGGRFYLPFLIVGIGFGFFAFATYVYMAVYYHIAKQIDPKD